MNAWIQALGLDGLKPLLVVLALPPVPWLVLIVAGGWLLPRRRRTGWALLLSGVAGIWAGSTEAAADLATRVLLSPPPALASPEALRGSGDGDEGRTVIVVLGGGRTEDAAWGRVTLNPWSAERLRYGIWLARETGLPLGFSGGVGPGSGPRGGDPGPSEGELAARMAEEEFRHPLHFVESRSRDTRENARHTVRLLQRSGIERLVLVTHQAHMPRALGHFTRERDALGLDFALIAAPMAVPAEHEQGALGDYLPSIKGYDRMWYALREWLGLLAGA